MKVYVEKDGQTFCEKSFTRARLKWNGQNADVFFFCKGRKFYVGNFKDNLTLDDLAKSFSNHELRVKMEQRAKLGGENK